MKHFPARSFRRILALGIVGAAFAVPVAQAMAKSLPPIDAGSSIPNPVYTQQQVRPDDRAGIRGVGATVTRQAYPDALERYVNNHYRQPQANAIRPDDRAGIRGVGVTVAPQAYPDALERYINNHYRFREGPVSTVRPDDRAGIRGPGITSEPAPLAAVGSGDGFNWSDAGIGAAISFAAALFLLAATVLLRRNRRGQLAV
jgi:hypothetical protein